MPEQVSVDEFLSKRELSSSDGVLYRAAKMPKTFDAESRSATFTMTDETVDSYGDIVRAKGCNLDRFNKNPIALLNHRADMIVGTWSDVEQKAKRIDGKVTLANEGTAPHIDMTFGLMSQGILRAASIGFMPTKVERRLDENGEPMWSYDILEWEMYEASIVAIPANPSCLARSIRAGDMVARDYLEEILDTYTKTASGLIVAKADLEAAYKEANGDRSVFSVNVGDLTDEQRESLTKSLAEYSGAVVEETRSAEVSESEAESVDPEVKKFSDVKGMTIDAINLLASRGMVFLTEYEVAEKTCFGDIIASDWEAAEAIAEERGAGEVVFGQLVEMVAEEKADDQHLVRAIGGGSFGAKVLDRDGSDVTESDEPSAKPTAGLSISVDTSDAEEKVTKLSALFEGLAAKFPMFFPKPSVEERIEPTLPAPEPADAEKIEAAKERAANARKRLAEKGLIEA